MQNNGNKPEWKNIAETQSEHELNQGHSFWLWAYRIGVAGSFTALAMFIVERMAGTDAQIWDYTGGQALNGFVGLVFAFAFSMFVYGFYLSDYSIKQRLFVFAVAVMFPLFAEVSQTMHRGEETQKVSSEASPEFIAAQKALAAMTGTNAAAGESSGMAAASGEKAKHEAELKACTRYTSTKKQANCERYEQAKIAEADGKAQGYSSEGNAALAAHQNGIAGMIGTIKELGNNQDHAHPMVKLFMQFGFSLLVASLIMAILIIGSIETALAWLGEHVKNYQKAMRARGLEIGNQNKAVVKTHHAESSPALLGESAPVSALHSTANSAAQTVADYAAKVEAGLKASPEIIAREYARADYANKQLMADVGAIGGKIGNKLDDALNAENRKNYPQKMLYPKGEGKTENDYHFIPRVDKTPALSGENTVKYLTPRMSVEETVKHIQASVKASGATSPEAIQAAVFDAFAALTKPAPLGDDMLQKIADKIYVKQIETAVPTLPSTQFSGGTGIHNPILGKAEAIYEMPLPVTTPDYPKGSETTPPVTTPDYPKGSETTPPVTTPDYPKGSEDAVNWLYAEWLNAVAERSIKPSNEPFNQFVFERTNINGLGKDRLKSIWDGFCARACGEGVLMLNPKYAEGNRKAKYILT